MSGTEYFLGVDAGGTKATFVLGDATRELARVRTGTIKRMKADAETAERNLQEGLQQLAAATGVAAESITRCCVGTAGETVPLVVDWLRKAFARHVGGELKIVGDVEIALDSAFFGDRGVLVLAGTGSNVAGRAATGEIVTAGGWGPAMADQGSGHFIGLEALRRGFLAIDQLRSSRVLDEAMRHWELGSRGELIEFANANPAPEYSRLAPLVVAAADAGDPVAGEVLDQGGRDLAMLAGLVIEHLRRIEGDAGFRVPAVAVAGSILEKVPQVRAALAAELCACFPGIVVLENPADPPAGALWAARQSGSGL
ncbi:MAG TPA: BadF/BadG/BcrA/BcrD ATPase family protein [Acidobacteriaceae bacterium]|jgi:N-acetylglucosamine kinase-like BadF-type ATPase|nr:BadF/BadG/BcrA/BcrD ATPase family protein [Acidobacteriaceae bacterium]